MSTDIFGSQNYDIPRQTSRCRILVYSHIPNDLNDKDFPGAINCSGDVIECGITKTIKAGGGASFTLVPRRNYLNFVFPNDYVYIYLDPGDGRGYILTFFGFVDRIDRSIAVGGNGESTTRYTVTCSDFTKAFDKTNVYFNPHIVDRGDFVSQAFAGTAAMGGVALRTKGVSIYGAPSDVVMVLSQRLMGFGSQFIVPPTHPKAGTLADESRKQRFENLKSVLASDFQELNSPEEMEYLRSLLNSKIQALVSAGKTPADGTASQMLQQTVSNLELQESTSKAVQQMISAPGFIPSPDVLVQSVILDMYKKANDPNYQHAIDESKIIFSKELNLLDLINFGTIEADAISGAILSAQIWQSQGSLWSIMNSWCNDLVNELFCDLRAVGSNDNYDLKTGGYSNTSDYLNANSSSSGNAIRLVPSIIMREYPFATVEAVAPSASVKVLGFNLGIVPLGGIGDAGIWSKGVNVAGRHTSSIEVLNPFTKISTPGSTATKHLDVCVVSVNDIINERIGRSDADVVNLIEVYADMGMGEMGKFMDNDVQPISNPISIARDGLRVRTYTSKFARWPDAKMRDSGLDSPGSRFQTIRWAVLLDHWYQHSKEYLNGTFTLRAFPEIRVGYRLDIRERAESYYVEGVSQNWTYTDKGGMLTTSVTVSRGQRNDPFPVYVLPALVGWGGISNRNDASRLATYFSQRNPSAVARSSMMYGNNDVFTDEFLQNYADIPFDENIGLSNRKGYLPSGAIPVTTDEYLKAAAKDLNMSYDRLRILINQKALEPNMMALLFPGRYLDNKGPSSSGSGSSNG